jgi:hypothetical protein
LEQLLKFDGIIFPRDDGAARFIKSKIHRVQLERHGWRKMFQPMRKQPQSIFRGVREIFPAGDAAEHQQRQGRDGISARLRAVVIILHAQNQIPGVGGALPEAAVTRVFSTSSVATHALTSSNFWRSGLANEGHVRRGFHEALGESKLAA